jgi:hypothetical protein
MSRAVQASTIRRKVGLPKLPADPLPLARNVLREVKKASPHARSRRYERALASYLKLCRHVSRISEQAAGATNDKSLLTPYLRLVDRARQGLALFEAHERTADGVEDFPELYE